MTGERRGARVFAIGRRDHRGASRTNQRGDKRQENLRSRRGYDMRCRGCAIGLRRGGLCRGERIGPGQPREQIDRQFRQRIRMGIDPGRKVEERFGSVSKQTPSSGEVAAMRERLIRIVGEHHVGRTCAFGHCAFRHADRALHRLSRTAGSRHRPPSDLDRRFDRWPRPAV